MEIIIVWHCLQGERTDRMSMEPGKNGGFIALLFPKGLVLTSLTDFHPCSVSFWALQLAVLRDRSWSFSQYQIAQMVEYGGFAKRARTGFFGRSAANTGAFCVCCCSLGLSPLLSFPANLFLFLRRDTKEPGASELDWLPQRQWVLLIPESALAAARLWGGFCWVFAFLSWTMLPAAVWGSLGEGKVLMCLAETQWPESCDSVLNVCRNACSHPAHTHCWSYPAHENDCPRPCSPLLALADFGPPPVWSLPFQHSPCGPAPEGLTSDMRGRCPSLRLYQTSDFPARHYSCLSPASPSLPVPILCVPHCVSSRGVRNPVTGLGRPCHVGWTKSAALLSRVSLHKSFEPRCPFFFFL